MEKNEIKKEICFCCKKEKECIKIDNRNVCKTCNRIPQEDKNDNKA